MRKLTREPSSPTYAASAAAELQRARSHFEGTGRLDGFDFNVYRDPEVKRALSKMSGGNCAYCEADYDATQPVDVEHFRPKKAIDTEGGWIQPGYWWLAADWDNLLDKTWTEAENFAILIEQLPEQTLWEPFTDEKYGNYYRNIQGIIEHTHYHLGQIVLIKKLLLNSCTH